MCLFNKRLLLTMAVLLTALQGVAQAASFIDVLDLPAEPSALASRSPLLDVVRAGQRLIAVGQRGHILYSDDSGKTWQQASVPVSSDLTAVYFPSAKQGWAVGNDGVVLHTEDAGATWSKQLDGRQIGAQVLDHYSALAKAEPDNDRWAELVAEGQRLVDDGADKPFLDVWFANEQLGYVVGVFNLILRTTDGGRNWVPFQDRTDNPQSLHLNAIASNGDALFIAGEQGLLLKWDDSLARFVSVPTPYQGSYFGVVGQPGELLAYGLRGHVFRSTNGGSDWKLITSGVQVSISAAARDSHGQILLFTQAGSMLQSSSDGGALKVLPQTAQAPVAGAILAPDNTLVLVGSRGVRVLPANHPKNQSE